MYAVIIPICNHIASFEDNKTIIDNTPMPNQRLQTRHLMLSCYYLQEALASGDYVYLFVNGKYNQFVVLCTHWILRGAYQEPERHVNIVSSDRCSRQVRIRFRNSSSYLSAVSTQDGEHIVSTQDGEQFKRQKGHNDRGVTNKICIIPKTSQICSIPINVSAKGNTHVRRWEANLKCQQVSRRQIMDIKQAIPCL